MKHHILLEFTSTKPLPTDFLDQVAGRVYIMDQVAKTECTARILSQEEIDILEEKEE